MDHPTHLPITPQHPDLRHILAEAEYLLATRSGLTYEAFVENETLRRAFAQSLEIIGEAAKKVPGEFRSRYPSVECPSGTRRCGS